MTLLAERPTTPVPGTDAGMPIDVKTIDLSSYEEFAGRLRFTRDMCDVLEHDGLLNERYEVLDGEIIVKMGQNRLQAVVMVLLMNWITSVFAGDCVQCQLPVEVAEQDRPTNRPEPDVSVLSRSVLEFLKTVPGPGDIQLVIEVSDTSLADDIRVKSSLYAQAGFPDYWILDAQGRRLIVHRDPVDGKYGAITIVNAEESVAPLSAPEKPVRVADLLPPAEFAN